VSRPAAAAVLLALLGAGAARAHTRSTSLSLWDLEPGPAPRAQVTVRVPWADLRQAVPELASSAPALLALQPDLGEPAAAYLAGHARLVSAAGPCPPDEPPRRVASPDSLHLAWSWSVRCPSDRALALRVDLFFDANPSHLHLARIRWAGAPAFERIFSADARQASLSGAASETGSSIARFVGLGVQHIATGLDHLAFLVGLLLLGGSAWEVAKLVTAFTVAHSLTLAAAVLGWVTPRPIAVDALIGLSIVVVALENFALTSGPALRRAVGMGLPALIGAAAVGALVGWLRVPVPALAGVGLFAFCYAALLERVPRPARLRWFVAFVFGLVHGFGFAGVLVELGLPADRLASSLLGFNAGVEVGQLAVVIALWPLLGRWVSAPRPGRQRDLLVQLGSTPVLAAGIFWFLRRSVG
jgi:hypothetical protein